MARGAFWSAIMRRFVGVLLIAGVVVRPAVAGAYSRAHATVAQSTAAQRFPYRRARTIDLTGANPRDSIVLTAAGKRADSLAITMTFYVNGLVAHQQRWTSEDEMNDIDAIRNSPPKLAAFMTKRLDDALLGVKRQPINREQVEHMGDAAALKKMSPSPTHQIMLSFGYENSIFMVWNAARKRMFVFMECC